MVTTFGLRQFSMMELAHPTCANLDALDARGWNLSMFGHGGRSRTCTSLPSRIIELSKVRALSIKLHLWLSDRTILLYVVSAPYC